MFGSVLSFISSKGPALKTYS